MPINPAPTAKRTEKKKNDFIISDPIFSFEDIVISDEVKEEIDNAISLYLYREKLFVSWNLQRVIKKYPNVCINIYGESGTGKTMTAHAIACELGMRMLIVNYADIESKYVGETSKNIYRLFEQAKDNNLMILFDEADALLSKRVTDMHNATDVSVNQTRSVLLTLLDTFEGVVVFTTNFITNFDSAFMRRIPNHIRFDSPDYQMRKKLLQHYLTNTIPNSINVDDIALKYEGLTGGDIANALVSSALKIARKGVEVLDQATYELALNKIIMAEGDNKGTRIVTTERSITNGDFNL